MKKALLLLLALFSYDTTYQAEEYTCKENEIKVKYEGEWYEVKLFNVEVKEDICGYIKGDVSFRFEKNKSIEEPYEVYLFVGKDLLQETLVEEKKAEVIIPSLAYEYTFQKETEKVLSKSIHEEKKASYSFKVALILITFYIFTLMFILRKRRGKRYK